MGSLNPDDVFVAAAAPMAQYRAAMKGDLEDWMPLEHAARLLLAGEPCNLQDYAADFRPIISMMRLIMEKSATGGWSWADPEVQKAFAEVASGAVYRLYADVLVALVVEVLRRAPVRTVVEIGAGTGFVTERLCNTMSESGIIGTRLVVTDMLPTVERLAADLRERHPGLDIAACRWNIREAPPPELRGLLAGPVLVVERFSLPYAGCEAIANLAAISDALLLVDDLSFTGEKAAFDHIYGRIGTQFLVLEETHRRLALHFSRIEACDMEVARAIRSPVSTVTLAVK